MTFKESLQKIQDAHVDWTFAQCWAQLKKTNPELFSSSLRPATAPNNVPDEPFSMRTGEESKDPRAKRFIDFDRPRDPRISAAAEVRKALSDKIQVIRAANPRMSLSDAWAKLRRDEPRLLARCALVEARLATE